MGKTDWNQGNRSKFDPAVIIDKIEKSKRRVSSTGITNFIGEDIPVHALLLCNMVIFSTDLHEQEKLNIVKKAITRTAM